MVQRKLCRYRLGEGVLAQLTLCRRRLGGYVLIQPALCRHSLKAVSDTGFGLCFKFYFRDLGFTGSRPQIPCFTRGVAPRLVFRVPFFFFFFFRWRFYAAALMKTRLSPIGNVEYILFYIYFIYYLLLLYILFIYILFIYYYTIITIDTGSF